MRVINNFRFTNSLLDSLWNTLFRNKSKDKKLNANRGSLYPIGYTTQYQRRYQLEIPFQPVRPVLNNFQNSIDLIEMATWSYELRHAVSIISRDIFQTHDGKITSWQIAELYQDKKVHPDVIAIGKDLADRMSGKSPILGGNYLQRVVRDFLFYGDAFVSLGFDKDGLSKNYYISDSLILPPLSVFADVDENNRIISYSQRESLYNRETDIFIHPLKILHFSYEKNEIYGMPISFQSLEAWRQLKELSADLEQAARDTGYSLLTHILPENSSENDREVYQQRYEEMLGTGIVTNLFLMPGTQIERIAANGDSLEPLMRLWLNKRYECLPPGIPLYFFPGLGLESSSGKEISGQPSLAYARMIAALRSILGEQIHWAVCLEIVMQRGYEFFEKHGKFDIEWGAFYVSGLEQGLMQQEDDEDEQENDKDNKPTKKAKDKKKD